MKLVISFLYIIIISFNSFAQQSKGWPTRPENVEKGIINNSKSQVLISGVPAYLWKNGCGPTALGMVIGYYDSNGFSDLIDGDALSQTDDVNNAIANDQHYNDYSLPKDYTPNLKEDKSSLGGAHVSNCIADFMCTSWSSKGNYWGWSYSNYIDDAFINYAAFKNTNYNINATYNYFNANSWNNYIVEIDNNRPVVLLVDSDGDGNTDHFVCGIGYDISQNLYAIYDTWDHEIHWYTWRGMSSSYKWGIYGFNKFQITYSVEIPENNDNKTISLKNYISKDLVEIITSEIITNIRIYNISGQNILSTKNKTINTTSLNSGIYFLKVSTRNNINYNLKFIKE